MSAPTIPLLTSHPVGWAVLGVAGYFLYKKGRKAGTKSADDIEKTPLHDRVVKGAMKSAYKAKMKVDESLSGTKEKYASMWNEAQQEAAAAEL